MLDSLKARLDKDNEKWLNSLSDHERDQVLAAARSWRGAVRYVWEQRILRRSERRKPRA